MTTVPTTEGPGRRRLPQRAQLWGPRPARTRPTVEVPDGVSVALESMTVAGLICAWLVVHLLVLGGLSEHRVQDTLYGQMRTQLAEATAPTGGIVTPGKPVSVLTIPALDLQQVVVEGTGSGQLTKGPGHLRDSVLPGQAGTAVIYGRARTYGGPFHHVPDLSIGDTITTRTAQGKATYRIDGIRRAGQPTPQPLVAGAGRLTLVTAQGGGGLLGSLTPDQVVYVDATLTSKAFAAPSGRLNAVSPAEVPMARDTSAVPALALSLGGLGIVVAGAVLLRRRLGSWLAWVLAAPVVIAITWMASDLSTYLLPNLL